MHSVIQAEQFPIEVQFCEYSLIKKGELRVQSTNNFQSVLSGA